MDNGMPAAATERLVAARAAVEHACQLLLSPTPEQLDRCAGLLESAVAEVTAFHRRGAVPDQPRLRAEMLACARGLASSLSCAKRLLESAGAFNANWIRCLAALCAGYTGQGQPAAMEHTTRLLARG